MFTIYTGFWESIGNWFVELWNGIVGFFSDFWNNLFNLLKDSVFRAVGITLIVESTEKGEPIPGQAWVNLVFGVIALIFGLMLAYKPILLFMGLFGKSRKYSSQPQDKKYAILIAARNESKVIANCIESLQAMDYPRDMFDIIVIADNCSDNTAEIAKNMGCIVYEHNDPNEKRKAYALRYFFNEFKKEHDVVESYYAYIIFDADTIAAPSFLTEMNNGMQEGGFDEACGYRNVKNLSENMATSISGINVHVAVVVGQRARSIMRTNQQVYGTSSCLRSYLLKDGWTWTTLTEDLDLEADLAAKGYYTGYVEDAVIYEEEPNKVRLFIRQQMRWTKGNWQSWKKYSWPLFVSFLKKPTWSKYDMYWQFFPYSIFSFYLGLIQQIVSIILLLIYGSHGYNWIDIFGYLIGLYGGLYISTVFQDALVMIKEWKRIHLSLGRAVLYVFLFPIYNLINIPVSAFSVFWNVKWKLIDHHYVVDANVLVNEEVEKAAMIEAKKEKRHKKKRKAA